jgi:hypothetical protein
MKPEEAEALEHLKNSYREALRLEQEMAEILASKDLSALRGNSRQKKALMEQLEKQFEELQPLLQTDDEQAEETLTKEKNEISALLKEIVELEEKNQQAIISKQAGSIEDIKQNRDARKFARGYRPSNLQRDTKIDKKG